MPRPQKEKFIIEVTWDQAVPAPKNLRTLQLRDALLDLTFVGCFQVKKAKVEKATPKRVIGLYQSLVGHKIDGVLYEGFPLSRFIKAVREVRKKGADPWL